MDCDDILNLTTDQHDIIEENEEEEDRVVVMEGVQEDVVEEVVPQAEVMPNFDLRATLNQRRNFNYKLDLTKKNIFYSDIQMPEKFLRDCPEQFEWRTMSDLTLEQIVAEVKRDIADPTPKLMILACFGKQLLQRSNFLVIDCVNELVNLVDEKKIHQISPSTNHFIPNKSATWEHVACFNAEMRKVNILRDMPPLTLHKAIMKRQYGDSGPLMVKGLMWQEFCVKDGLGDTLSNAGYLKYKHFIMLAFEYHFLVMDRKPSQLDIGTPRPPPLAITEGYENNTIMTNILREKGLLNLHRAYIPRPAPPPRFAPPAPAVAPPPPPPPATPPPPPATPPPPPASTPPPTIQQRAQLLITQPQGGARRKVVVSNADDSGFFADDEPMEDTDNAPVQESERRNYNEYQIDRARLERDITREQITFDELQTAYERLKTKQERDERYFKDKVENLEDKVDNLEFDNEKLQEDKDDLKEEVGKLIEEVKQLSLDNEEIKKEGEGDRKKLRTTVRKLEDKEEQLKFSEERVVMLEQQYKFVMEMYNGVGDMLFDKDKKRKNK